MKPIKVANLKLFALNQDEKIIGEARRHPIGFFVIFINAVIIIGIIDVILYLSIEFQVSIKESVSILESFDVATWASVIVLIMTILVFGGSVMAAYVYHHNYIVLTNQKIVLVHSFSLVKRRVSQLSIGDIQDVSAAQSTLMSRFFSYGTIMIETSGEQRNVWMTYLSSPLECAGAIMTTHESDVQLHGN